MRKLIIYIAIILISLSIMLYKQEKAYNQAERAQILYQSSTWEVKPYTDQYGEYWELTGREVAFCESLEWTSDTLAEARELARINNLDCHNL